MTICGDIALSSLNDLYYLVSAVMLGSFIVLAIVVSPNTGYGNTKDFLLLELDRVVFIEINNAFHNNPFIGQLMVAMTEFGREAF